MMISSPVIRGETKAMGGQFMSMIRTGVMRRRMTRTVCECCMFRDKVFGKDIATWKFF